MRKRRSSQGSGRVDLEDFREAGRGVVIEPGVRVFHPERISLGEGVYIGHDAILNGYHAGQLTIGAGSWIGPQTFLHGAGGLEIGRDVGVGPGTRIITSIHVAPVDGAPILYGDLSFAQVLIGDGSDLGMNAVVLPGVTIGRGVQVGAGAVVSCDLPDFSVAVGVPARVIRIRQ